MVDNVTVNPGTQPGKIVVATDDVGGVHFPVYKLATGLDGEAVLISKDNAVPVDVSRTDSLLEDLILEQRLTNAYLASMVGEDFREDIETDEED